MTGSDYYLWFMMYTQEHGWDISECKQLPITHANKISYSFTCQSNETQTNGDDMIHDQMDSICVL